jgi:hypothetical protein
MLLSKAIHGWSWFARDRHLKNINQISLIQTHPIMIYSAVFRMRGMEELSFFCRVFRAWRTFYQRRKLWKAFAHYSENINDEQEYKAKLFYALLRASQQKLVRRFSHPSNRYFPHKCDFSFDALWKWKLQASNLFEVRNQKYWNFMTEIRNSKINFTATLLIRSLVFAIHYYQPYDQVTFPNPKLISLSFPADWKPRTLAELDGAVRSNCAHLRL